MAARGTEGGVAEEERGGRGGFKGVVAGGERDGEELVEVAGSGGEGNEP